MSNDSLITEEEYDELMEHVESEDFDAARQLFVQYGLTLNSPLLDAPRYNETGDELLTYLDYIIAHSLTSLIDDCVNNEILALNDDFFARCLQINALDVYQYFRDLYPQFYPAGQSLCESVKLCYADIADDLLTLNAGLIHHIDNDVIEYLFSFDIDEETLETIRVLFNHSINPALFNRYLGYLHNPEAGYFKIDEDDQDLVIELIDILESNGVFVE